MCVNELLHSRFLYEFHELERREVQCTLNFCIFLKVCGPVHSLNTNSIYLSILQTGSSYFLICDVCILKHVLGLSVFFLGFFHIELQKSNQKTAICAWKEKFWVLLLRFQNKVLKDIVFQYLPVFYWLNYSDMMVVLLSHMFATSSLPNVKSGGWNKEHAFTLKS